MMKMLMDELQNEYEKNGVSGPIKVVSETEAKSILSEISIINDDISPIYGVRTNRDRHLHVQSLYDLGVSENIVGRVRKILGDDVVLFRSDCFRKIPSIPSRASERPKEDSSQGAYDVRFEYLDWHQGTNFTGPSGVHSIGRRKRKEERYRDYYWNIPIAITIWVALTKSIPENGAVQYWKGSHLKGPFGFRKCAPGEGLGKSDYKLDVSPPNDESVMFSLSPGEGLLFDNRIVHRSGNNLSPNVRVGVGFRYVRSDVDIYGGLRHDPYGLPLDNWGVVSVSGKVLNPGLRVANPRF